MKGMCEEERSRRERGASQCESTACSEWELFYKKCLQVLIFVKVLSGRVNGMNPCTYAWEKWDRTWSFFKVAVHISIYGSSVIIIMWTARIGPKVYLEREGISQFTPSPLQNLRKFPALSSFCVVSDNGMRIIYLKCECFKGSFDLLNSFPNYLPPLNMIGKEIWHPWFVILHAHCRIFKMIKAVLDMRRRAMLICIVFLPLASI